MNVETVGPKNNLSSILQESDYVVLNKEEIPSEENQMFYHLGRPNTSMRTTVRRAHDLAQQYLVPLVVVGVQSTLKSTFSTVCAYAGASLAITAAAGVYNYSKDNYIS